MTENIDSFELTKHNQGPLKQNSVIEQEIIFDDHEFMVNEEDESILHCKGMLYLTSITIILIIIIKIEFCPCPIY